MLNVSPSSHSAENSMVRTKERIYRRKPRASRKFLICVGGVEVEGEVVGKGV